MAKRPKHQNKDLEAIIVNAEERGWTASKGKGYFHLRCPCGLHQKWVALTPSGARYGTNLKAWLHRQPCWQAGQGGDTA